MGMEGIKGLTGYLGRKKEWKGLKVFWIIKEVWWILKRRWIKKKKKICMNIDLFNDLFHYFIILIFFGNFFF